MISAANADGFIDADERANIINKLRSVDLDKEEHEFIVHELLAPKPVEELLSAVKTPEMARQVYTVSLMAIDLDTQTERDYLRDLARAGVDVVTLGQRHARSQVDVVADQDGVPAGQAHDEPLVA